MNMASCSSRLGALVTEEGGEAHTINLCKLCYNERVAQQGKHGEKLSSEKLTLPGYGRFLGWNTLCAECGNTSHHEKEHGQKRCWHQWQENKEVLEQVKRHTDMGCDT